MIYFFSDFYVYTFENLYPLYLRFEELGVECCFDADFSCQGQELSQKIKKYNGTSNLNKIRKGELPRPKLVILNQCWSGIGPKLSKEFSSKGVPVITTEHGSPMLYYGHGHYRGDLKGSCLHPTWGNVGKQLMVKFGCKSNMVPALGSPRIDHYFSKREITSDKTNNAVIFGTAEEGTRPWSTSIQEKIEIICKKHDNVKFKGKNKGLMKLANLDCINKDFSSDDFYKLFNDIGHAYFWFPSSLMTIAKIMGCKTYALYSDSQCHWTKEYFIKHKSHIFSYESEQDVNADSNLKFLSDNLTPGGTDNIINFILNEKSFNINN